MAEIPDKERRTIIISILNTHAKSGCSLVQLNREYEQMTGQKMAKSRAEAIELLKSMSDAVKNENGLYFSESKKSLHIVKFVEDQKESSKGIGPIQRPKNIPNRQNHAPFRPNNSYNHNRSVVSYSDWDSPSTSNHNSSFRPNRIQDRRKSLHVSSNVSQQNRPKRRNSCVGDRDETFEPKAKRSRSKSPVNRSRNEHDDRWRSRQSNGNDRRPKSPSPKYPSRSSSRPRRRSPSPRRRSPLAGRRSPSPRRRSPSPRRRSPSAGRRSPPQRRSIARQSISPPGKRSAHSPVRFAREKSPIPSTSSSSNKHSSRSPDKRSRSPDKRSRSPDKKSRTPEVSPPKRTQPAAANASTPLSEQPKPMLKIEDRKAVEIVVATGQPKKQKKYKFTVIGDGYMYYLMSDMQGELKTEMPFCNHNKTIAEALYMLDIQKDRLQQRRKKVLISIGATDLRMAHSFGDMKRDFTHLFLQCDALGLKPLVTTVYCIDSPELKERADLFNKFLMENFENVVDMKQVGRIGLANAMLMTHNRAISTETQMELGRLQQLVLKV